MLGVTLGNITQYTNSKCISIQVTDGNYNYAVSQVSGYIVSPLSGSVSVNHSSVLTQVYYAKEDPPAEVFVSDHTPTLMIAVLVSAEVTIAVTYIFFRKKRGS